MRVFRGERSGSINTARWRGGKSTLCSRPTYALLKWCSVSAPPTSVASERLFSAAGDIYSDQPTQLAPERAEMLLFVRENLKYIACLDHLAN